jgi:hypothetical protein
MGTLSVNQFNNTSGPYAGDTLDSIVITLYGQGSVVFNAELFNNGSLTINSLTTNVTLTASGAVAPVNLNLTDTYTPGSPIVINTAFGTYTSPSQAIPLGSDSSGTLTDHTDLVDFTGIGNMNFSLAGSAPVTYSGTCTNGSFCGVGGTTDAGGYVIVTYDYSGPPVVTPEPGTLGLFGTGLLGLAGLLRFKFMKSK